MPASKYGNSLAWLAAQAKVQGLHAKTSYTAATSFPVYAGKFGNSVEGVPGAGGIDPDTSAMKAYFAAHKKVTGKAPDFWASGMAYATFEILGQAIERVGTPSISRGPPTSCIRTAVIR